MIRKPAIIARNLHKWLGLLVGAQVLIWLLSGLYMVIVNIDFIHGDSLVRNTQRELGLPGTTDTGVADLIERFPEATTIDFTAIMEKTHYTIRTPDQSFLVDPVTGEVVSPLAEEQVRRIASYHFNGEAGISRTVLIESDPPMEIQTRRLPLWRVDFDDSFSTSFYIDPVNGALVTRRFSFWRIFDFMWMLHIMDYEERQDAHHPLLIGAQITGLTFALTGAWLLFYSFSRRKSAKPTGSSP